MTVQRVLVAGGAGYIGSHAAKALRKAGREPVVFDDLSSGHEHAVRWGPLVRGDIRDAEAVRAAIRQHRPDAVMHFAARIEVGEGEHNPAAFYDNNVAGTLNLVAGDAGGGREEARLLVDLRDLWRPRAAAADRGPAEAAGQRLWPHQGDGEQMLEDISRAHGLNFAALRYFNAAGADP